MAIRKLGPDATIVDVVHSLSKPLDYVCGVLDNLYKCRKQHGNAEVVIGTTGKGLKPYYRIMYSSDGQRQTFDTFFDNHTSFSVEDMSVKDGPSWSNQSMTLQQVAEIRGTLKG